MYTTKYGGAGGASAGPQRRDAGVRWVGGEWGDAAKERRRQAPSAVVWAGGAQTCKRNRGKATPPHISVGWLVLRYALVSLVVCGRRMKPIEVRGQGGWEAHLAPSAAAAPCCTNSQKRGAAGSRGVGCAPATRCGLVCGGGEGFKLVLIHTISAEGWDAGWPTRQPSVPGRQAICFQNCCWCAAAASAPCGAAAAAVGAVGAAGGGQGAGCWCCCCCTRRLTTAAAPARCPADSSAGRRLCRSPPSK